MTALSIWGPYALRRSVNKFSSSALGKTNKFLLRSLMRRFAGITLPPPHAKMMVPEVSVTTRVVGAPKRQGCATQLRYRSGYRRCIEQVIYCNSIDLWRVVRLNGSLFLFLFSMQLVCKLQHHYPNRNTF